MQKSLAIFYILLLGYSFYSLFLAGGGVLLPFAVLFLYSLNRDLKKNDSDGKGYKPFFRAN